jgi:hypothetical protein
MGCANGKKSKLESFNRATEGRGGGAAAGGGEGGEVHNRYIVGVDEDGVGGADGANKPVDNSDGDDLAMYTNISDFKAEKGKKKKKKRSGDDGAFDDLGTGMDGDLAAFKESLKRKKKAPKRNKNLVMNESSAQLPGTELGIYDRNEPKATFVGGDL